MHQFTCHVTRRDDIVRRVEVDAVDVTEARRMALAGQPGRVSCRANAAPIITTRIADARLSFGGQS